MPADLIPALDPSPLPGPPWLFHVLWVVTFLIHVLLLNVVLGGTLLAAFAPGPERRSARFLVRVNSWAISLAITFAIAPLLFTQVLFGRFFYSATVLVPWTWLGMLGLLTVAYYLNYLAKGRLEAGRSAGGPLVVEAVFFLAIAAIQVVVNILQLRPERWEAVATGGLGVALADPTYVPRLLHFLLAALAMAGAGLAFAAIRADLGGSAPASAAMARSGVRVALMATIAQIVVGFWFLLALPEQVLRAFMRGGFATAGLLGAGILLAIGLLVVLARVTDPAAQPKLVRRSAELIVGATVLMVVVRHELRLIYLAPVRAAETVEQAPQWVIIGLFLALFVAGVAVTVWALVRAAKDRPAGGETAA